MLLTRKCVFRAVPPKIPSPPGDVSVPEGHNVSLLCQATGDPAPALQWRREDGTAFVVGGRTGTFFAVNTTENYFHARSIKKCHYLL